MATATAPVAAAERVAPRTLALISLTALGAAASFAVAFHVGDPPVRAADARSFARGLALALYVVVGTYTSWRRPQARFGFYLIGIGLLFSVASPTASQHEVPHSVGRAILSDRSRNWG